MRSKRVEEPGGKIWQQGQKLIAIKAWGKGMRYKTSSMDNLLNGLAAETWACLKSGDRAKHLGYIHAIVHELWYRLCQVGPKGYGEDRPSN